MLPYCQLSTKYAEGAQHAAQIQIRHPTGAKFQSVNGSKAHGSTMGCLLHPVDEHDLGLQVIDLGLAHGECVEGTCQILHFEPKADVPEITSQKGLAKFIDAATQFIKACR